MGDEEEVEAGGGREEGVYEVWRVPEAGLGVGVEGGAGEDEGAPEGELPVVAPGLLDVVDVGPEGDGEVGDSRAGAVEEGGRVAPQPPEEEEGRSQAERDDDEQRGTAYQCSELTDQVLGDLSLSRGTL
jgi:hypothetical protein